MASIIFILGESGSGKSRSIKNLPPDKTMVVNVDSKPLPFRHGKEWTIFSKDNPKGNIYCSDNVENIIKVIKNVKQEIIVIDDFQYLMQNEYMRRCKEKSYDKFTDISDMIGRVLQACKEAEHKKRIYILSHTEETAQGKVKIKTVGKAVDQYITPEGKATIVLRTHVTNGVYEFSTQNDGNDTCKSPEEMFPDPRIENDLAIVDKFITDYYGI
ncbi:hypothetical protein [Acinetobacter phage HFM1]|nr:hypothetical protein [Acinetobacter phage HFM1]